MYCWQENNCDITCSEQEADRKKLPKTSATISFFRKEYSLIVNNWKLGIEKNSCWWPIAYYVAALRITRYIEGSIETSPPGPFSHNFALLQEIRKFCLSL